MRRIGPAARWLDAALVAASGGVCASVGFALLARYGWFFELFAHFPLQYVVLLLALAAALAARHRFGIALGLLPVAAIASLPLVPYWPRAQAEPLDEGDLTLMTANLNGYHDEHAPFIELALAESPDVLVLLEVSPGWARALEALGAEYPHRLVHPRDDPFGVAILSRLPLLDARTIDLEGAPVAAARIGLPGDREVELLGVHLRPPTSPRLAAERNTQLERLLPLVRATGGPMVVTGDFNSTPYSPYLRDWLASARLRDPRRGREIGATWPTAMPLLGIPIDHCLVSEHFIVAEYRQGPAFGSDHYPVIARLALRGNP